MVILDRYSGFPDQFQRTSQDLDKAKHVTKNEIQKKYVKMDRCFTRVAYRVQKTLLTSNSPTLNFQVSQIGFHTGTQVPKCIEIRLEKDPYLTVSLRTSAKRHRFVCGNKPLFLYIQVVT